MAPSTSSTPRLSASSTSSTLSMFATELLQHGPNHLGIAATVPSTPRTSALAPLFQHQGPRRPGPRRPCPRQPRHRRHCASDTTYLCTTRCHGPGEFPRHLCLCLFLPWQYYYVQPRARLPPTLPCLCSASVRKSCHLPVRERRLHDALFFWVSPR